MTLAFARIKCWPRSFQIDHFMLTRYDQLAETWRNLGDGAAIPGVWNELRPRRYTALDPMLLGIHEFQDMPNFLALLVFRFNER